MRALVAVLVLLLLLALGVLVSFLNEDEIAPLAERKHGVATGDGEFEEGRRRETSRVPAQVEPLGPGGVADEFPDRGPIREPVEDGLLVRCLDARTGDPVPGIDVRVTRPRGEDSLARFLLDQDPDFDLRGALRYRADHRGLVRVAVSPERPARIVVSNDEMYGEADSFEAPGDSLEVRLHPLKRVLVRVLDRLGTPVVGAPVTWCHGSLEVVEGRRLFDRRFRSSRGRTEAPDGSCRLRLPGIQFKTGSQHFVVLDGILGDLVAAEIDPDDLPDDAITLIAPDHGSLEIEFRPRDGEEKLPGTCVLRIQENRVDAKTGRPPHYLAAPSELVLLEDGRACIDFIETGLELAIHLDAGRLADFEPIDVVLRGPTRPGEIVRALLRPPAKPDRLVLSGRLLDPEGAALGSREVNLRLRFVEGGVQTGERSEVTRTDADGRFRVGLPDSRPKSPRNLRLSLTTRLDSGTPVHGTAGDIPLVPGFRDLGDLRTTAEPILVTGRVFDVSGRGLAGLRVEARIPQRNRERGGRGGGPVFRTTTGANGRFALHGGIRGDRLVVHVEDLGWQRLSEAREVPVGAMGIDFEVLLPALLRATVVVDNPDLLAGLRLQVWSKANEALGYSIPHDGRFRARITPGTFEVRVGTIDEVDEFLYLRSGLVVASGETLDLGVIELAAPGRMLRLSFVDENDEPIASGRLVFRLFRPGAVEARGIRSGDIRPGGVSLFVPEFPLEIEVDLPGYRTRRCSVTESRAKIRLRRESPVRLVVEDLERLPSDVSLSLVLRSIDKKNWNEQTSGSLAAGQQDCLIASLTPGRYAIDCFVVLKRPRGSKVQDLLPSMHEQVIEIIDAVDTQSFRVVIDPAALARTIAEIRRALDGN